MALGLQGQTGQTSQTPQYGQFQNVLGQVQPASQAQQGVQQGNLIPEKAKQPQGTGYTNLQSIINANQGNQLGSAVTNTVANAGTQAQNNLQQQQSQFNSGIQQAGQTQATRQSEVNNTLNQVAGWGNQSNPSGQNSTPTQAQLEQSINPNAIQFFQQLPTTSYTGPTGLNNTQQLQNQAQQAAQYGQLAGSNAGRQQLLQQTFAQPGYGQAQQSLDAILLGQNMGSLNQAAANNRGINNQVGQGIANAQGQGSAQAAALQQLQQQAAGGVAQLQGQVQNAAQQNYNTAAANYAANQGALANLSNVITNNNPGANDSNIQQYGQAAGLTPQQISALSQTVNSITAPEQWALGNAGSQTNAALNTSTQQNAIQSVLNTLGNSVNLSAFPGSTGATTAQQIGLGANTPQLAQLDILAQLANQAPQYTNFQQQSLTPTASFALPTGYGSTLQSLFTQPVTNIASAVNVPNATLNASLPASVTPAAWQAANAAGGSSTAAGIANLQATYQQQMNQYNQLQNLLSQYETAPT